MTKLLTLAATIALTAAAAYAAQTKTIPGDMVTVTAKVEAIEMQSRTLTLKKTDGTYTTFVVPKEYERFTGIKVGDTVTARYYDNIVFRKLNPGEKPVDSASAAVTLARRQPSGWYGRHAAHDHHDDHRDRREDPVDHVDRTERLGLQLEGPGQAAAQDREGRRQGQRDLDRSGLNQRRRPQVANRPGR